ncbi:MAG: hypothetical protein R3C30_15085 [Hyphomonadaceae bacterium]
MPFFTPTEAGLFDPGGLEPMSYWAHLLIGTLGILAALTALMSAKGRPVHRAAGFTFAVCVLVAGATAISFSFTRFAPPAVLSSLVALYAVATSWLALRRAEPSVKRTEQALTGIIAIATLLFSLAATRAILVGIAPLADALSVALVPIILLVGDVLYFRNYDERGAIRLRRHVWRMSWALAIAIRAPLFELRDDFSLNPLAVNYLPLLLPPLVMLLFASKLGARRAEPRAT